MPEEDGLSIVRWLKQSSAVPVIMLTATRQRHRPRRRPRAGRRRLPGQALRAARASGAHPLGDAADALGAAGAGGAAAGRDRVLRHRRFQQAGAGGRAAHAGQPSIRCWADDRAEPRRCATARCSRCSATERWWSFRSVVEAVEWAVDVPGQDIARRGRPRHSPCPSGWASPSATSSSATTTASARASRSRSGFRNCSSPGGVTLSDYVHQLVRGKTSAQFTDGGTASAEEHRRAHADLALGAGGIQGLMPTCRKRAKAEWGEPDAPSFNP